MLKRKRIVILPMVAMLVLAGRAIATPITGTVVAETARGTLGEHLDVRTSYDNGAGVLLKTKGDIEIITQRIVAEPGSSFGWHSHPGENVNVVAQGTLTLYHDDRCTSGTNYGPGTAFPTSPRETHLARNNGTETLIVFATYFAPKTDPPLPVRVDQPLPAPGCPE